MTDDLQPRKRSFIPFLLIVLLVGAALGVYWLSGTGKPQYEFKTEEVTRGNVTATVAATGLLESTTTVTVGSQVSGPVREVLADFNTQVKVGQVLAVLDPSEFEARLSETEAGLELVRAGLQNAQAKVLGADANINKALAQIERAHSEVARVGSQVDSAVANVDSAQAQVLRARAEMENALAEFKRFETLYKRQLVAASELDQKRTAYKVQAAAYENTLAAKVASVAAHRQALASLDGTRDDLRSAEVQLASAQTERRAAQAQVSSERARLKQAEAVVEKARVDLTRTVLRSPIDGVVIERKIEPGQTVAASFQAPELFRIARDLHHMRVKADVSEADIGQVSLGQKVTFSVDAYPDQKFEGKVVQVRPAPATTTGNAQNNVIVYGVLIEAPNPKLLLKPGMTATVSIATKELKDVLLVPDDALRFLPPNPPDPKEEKKKRERDTKKEPKVTGRPGIVWVETPTGPQRRDLILGVGDGKVSEVKAGDLKAGEKVYTKLIEEKKSRRFRLML